MRQGKAEGWLGRLYGVGSVDRGRQGYASVLVAVYSESMPGFLLMPDTVQVVRVLSLLDIKTPIFQL